MDSQNSSSNCRSRLTSDVRVSGGRRALFNPSLAADLCFRPGSGPLVSVITVVRNGESTIGRCIESVLAQTYTNTEHIIVDGGSSDQTVPILRSYGDKISLWISEPDKGIYNALNKGIELARGSHYIPLGCDDVILTAGVENLISRADENLVIFGKVRFVDAEKQLMKMIYNHSAGVLINTRLHAELGLYDETYRIAADTKFLQLAERASYVQKIDEVVGEFAIGGASSNYGQSIREHARAMFEAGSWSAARTYCWLAPRLLWSLIRP